MCVRVCYENVFASVGKILLTKKGGALLLQVAHTGQHGSSTRPANFTKVHVDLVNECLDLAVIQKFISGEPLKTKSSKRHCSSSVLQNNDLKLLLLLQLSIAG